MSATTEYSYGTIYPAGAIENRSRRQTLVALYGNLCCCGASAPFIHVHVRDTFIDGIGAGDVGLLSLVPLGRDRDKPEPNSGALYRYLAEAVWHPLALLPQAGVHWKAIDEHRATATLTAYGISVSLEFRFNAAGEIVGVYTEDRYGRFDGKYIKYPWEGHFSDYQEVDGVRIPLEGEVGWHLPDGWWLFWQGEIVIG